MHKILVNTHKESNINILKARDYYFDKARFINNRLRRICLWGPIILSVAGMVIGSVIRFSGKDSFAQLWDDYLDILVGCFSIFVFIIDFFLVNKVGDNLSKSNALRELYDVKVLDLVPNEFFYHYTEQEINSFIEMAKHVKDSDKYEVWYREIFSGSDFANAICAMMDNVIYTYHVYTENMKQHMWRLLATFLLFVLYCVVYATGRVLFLSVNPFVLFLSIFDYIKETIDGFFTSKDLVQNNKALKESIVSNSEELLASPDKKIILRCIQDVIIDNREKGLFISKSVRNKFLSNDCAYYKELDSVKQIFWGNQVEKPQYAGEFEIGSVEDEDVLINFEMIHTELKEMLKDISDCLAESGISFMLDGGTLIGACRSTNNQGFLQWDDDIDISVKSSDVNHIKELIHEKYSDKYEIQDYYNEEGYSPRLATFRIRQKNSVSKVCEKDSELFELYSKRGLFIDVYAYCPILGWRWSDALYRTLFIHPLNKKIRKIETEWKVGTNPDKAFIRFKKLKMKYMERVNWYIRHAKNKKYVSYEPFYIYDLKKPGPYIRDEDMYGEKQIGVFEGTEYEIPFHSEAVLRAFYGEKWEVSPFSTLDSIREDGKLLYSQAEFDATCYKHLKRVSLYK